MTALHQFGKEMLKLSRGLETVATTTVLIVKSPTDTSTKSIGSAENYPDLNIDNISKEGEGEEEDEGKDKDENEDIHSANTECRKEFINPIECQENRKDSTGIPQVCVQTRTTAASTAGHPSFESSKKEQGEEGEEAVGVGQKPLHTL